MDEESVFAAALEKKPDQREAFLDGVCAADPALRASVEALLQAYEQAGGFLNQNPEGQPTINHAPISERTGSSIGSYKLLEQIGEGGFGVVFMAEQQKPIQRKVALKVIKPGMDTKEVVARFEAERQALALMDHPNIARVFDAGATESGRPYFVMELVKGIPITDYCDKMNLTPEERLRLFDSVCNAVQHAHQKGIIHRDIKPSNVLVTLHDSKPVVKVIDFGVAKAINQRLTERTLFTRFAQLVGTPMYMSPEQAELSGLDVDTRTDVYSLGVLLYELMTGVTPFDKKRLSEAGYDEVRRIIREEDPPKPSTKISTLGDSATDISLHRRMEPKRLSAWLKGDVDWIVMKALEKERTRRYETAKDLASDILRYLNHEPVDASPPSLTYRTRKFVRRHRIGVAAITAAALLVTLMALAGWHVSRAELEKRATKAEKELIDRKLRDQERENAERLAEEERRREKSDGERQLAEQHARDLKWLMEDALPEIETLKKAQRWQEAFQLAERAKEKFSDDKRVQQAALEVTCVWSVVTEPPGAAVQWKPYEDADAPWQELGTTPLERVSLARGFYRWKIARAGFEPIEGCAGPQDVNLRLDLDKPDPLRLGMVHVRASLSEREVDFWIDKHEVTNAQFKRFVDAGGYQDRKYWKHPFYNKGQEIPWDEAMKSFVDSSGRAGPLIWEDGAFPDGEEDFPVRGVSWYEAAAFAEFSGKTLPTVYDWELAAGGNYSNWIVKCSNLGTPGPRKVGECQSVGPYGTCDMAGNVKEWCCNGSGGGRRYLLGGAWHEPTYMFTARDAQFPRDRSDVNGFRCIRRVIAAPVQQSAEIVAKHRDYDQETPMSDAEFEKVRQLFAYARTPLNARTVRSTVEDICRYEIVEFDAAYEDYRMIAHVFLPIDAHPPLQVVVFFPGGGCEKERVFPSTMFRASVFPELLASGRAVVWPIYFGTFERGGGTPPNGQRGLANQRIREVQDLCRTLDYLADRPDMDLTKLAYLGESYGGLSGPLFLAIDDRFKAAVFLVGGLPRWEYAREIDPLHFAPRVKTPTLMVNGRDDEIFPLVTSQVPLFRYLGTPASEKEHYVADGSHAVEHQILASETLRWFDRYLGPVDSQAELQEFKPEEKRARLLSRAETLLHAARYVDAIALCDEILADQGQDLDTDDPAVLLVMRVKAEALEKNSQTENALSLYDKTLAIQRRILGAEHPDTRATAQRLVDLCTNMAWGFDFPTVKAPTEYDRAFELIQKALRLVAELDPPAAQRSQWACLAYIQCRRGNGQAALEAMEESFIHDEPYFSQWLYMAMIHGQLGHQDLARDWFAAACEWMIKKNVTLSGFLQLRDEVATVVGLAGQPLPADFDEVEWIDRYTRLIADQPGLARLYHCRGSHYGRRQQWPEAAADYLKAAELQPTTWDHAQAHAAVVFFTQPMQDHTALCRQLFGAFLDHKDPGVRMNLVTHCSVVPEADLDREALNRLADGVFAETSHNPYTDLGKGMALYRLGRFEEALGVLPDDSQSFGSEKDELLARLFRAMTHRQLGDTYTSRRLLDRARENIQAKLAGPDGPLCRYEDRPVVWCMVQTMLREAETLIEPHVMTRGSGE